MARAVFAADVVTPIMIELMHVYGEDFHRHQGRDLDALMLRLAAAAGADEDEY